MKTPEGLLVDLGLSSCTHKQLQILNAFIVNEETDCKKLLDKLGSWDENDLAIAECWAKQK